jgi:Domain of unknown function (DUF4388)
MQLNGDLAKVSLNNLLQLVRNGELTGKITLLQGAKTASIFVERGNVVHVEADNIKGREALFELFLWVSGSFSFVEGEFGGITRTLNPASPEDSLERLLREGMNYLEQKKILEQMRIGSDTILATTDRVEELILASANNPRLAAALAMVQPIVMRLDGRSPLAEVIADLNYSRRAYVQAMAIVMAEGLATVVEPATADEQQPIHLPSWVHARLQQDNPNLTQAIIDMVIWVDRVKCWMYQADSDFAQILTNISGSVSAGADDGEFTLELGLGTGNSDGKLSDAEAMANESAPTAVRASEFDDRHGGDADAQGKSDSGRNLGSKASGANESARSIEF